MLVLHAHLPYVRHPEFPEYREESWLFEALTECYLPLLKTLGRYRDGRAAVAMSLSPTLLEMLADGYFRDRYDRYLAKVTALAGKQISRAAEPAETAVLEFYLERLAGMREFWERDLQRDVTGGFVRLAHRGVVELFTTAATHVCLPLYQSKPDAVRRQVAVGLKVFERHTGLKSAGFWLPECAYFEGLDSLLVEFGIRYFFVDTHMMEGASPRPRHGTWAPVVCPSGVTAFGRDERLSHQVWSATEGYPADPVYRDFHSDLGFELPEAEVLPHLWGGLGRGMTGLKLKRVTGGSMPKEAYDRSAAVAKVLEHADHFIDSLERRMAVVTLAPELKPLAVAMYDAELMGHWWFEGPDFLGRLLEALSARDSRIRTVTPSSYLSRNPVLDVAEPGGGSWGAGGYFAMWMNPSNDWILPELLAAETELETLKGEGTDGSGREMFVQCLRELMLAEASDWPFLLAAGTCGEYGAERVRAHRERFRVLFRGLKDREAGRIPLEEYRRSSPLFAPEDLMEGWNPK